MCTGNEKFANPDTPKLLPLAALHEYAINHQLWCKVGVFFQLHGYINKGPIPCLSLGSRGGRVKNECIIDDSELAVGNRVAVVVYVSAAQTAQ